jgi:hypothetical protein
MFDAAAFADTPLMQDPAFAAALRLCGETPVVLPSGLIVLYRRICGVPIAMIPRAAPPVDLDAQLCRAGLQRLPLILSPERPCDLPRGLRLSPPVEVLSMDLTRPDPIRRAALHGKWRNQLRRAEASGLRIGDAPLSPDSPLLTQEVEQARLRGYANWPAALTAAFATIAPEQTRLFTAYDRGHAVARMLFLCHGARATYHIGHITPRGKALCAHNLLLWQASCWLSDLGSTTLDLGRADPATPTLTRFKRRAGGQPETTGGTWLRWRPLARNKSAWSSAA